MRLTKPPIPNFTPSDKARRQNIKRKNESGCVCKEVGHAACSVVTSSSTETAPPVLSRIEIAVERLVVPLDSMRERNPCDMPRILQAASCVRDFDFRHSDSVMPYILHTVILQARIILQRYGHYGIKAAQRGFLFVLKKYITVCNYCLA